MFPAKADTGQMAARHSTTTAQCSIRHPSMDLQSKGQAIQLDWVPRKLLRQTREFRETG